jgi:CheY-like chemotaxis protein
MEPRAIKILVCEDEVHIQRLVRLVLEKQGYEVTVASNGDECLKLLGDGLAPDLVLLDILMPGIDGLQVLRTIKSNPTLKNLSVVLLTALAQENVVLQGIKLGAKDYIRKPFNPKDLVQRIQKHLPQIDALKKSS